MAKMARAVMVVLAAGPANLPVLQDTHTGIKETIQFTIRGASIRNFANRATNNFIGAEDTKLNAYNCFCI